jgi:hypothetical protein
MSNLSAMLKQAQEWRSQIDRQEIKHIEINGNDAVIYTDSGQRLYTPSPTGIQFHEDSSFVKLVIGPYGSGKSTMCIAEIVRRTCAMPVWSNGRRRARWAVVRNTSGELVSTTLQTWLAWFGDLGDISKRQKPIMTYEHTFSDQYGVVELEIIFLALDRPDDVRKVKSLELTGVYLNELSELPPNALAHFKGRVNGRYPSKGFCSDPYWSGIIADTNPPSEDHWLYKDFEVNRPPDYKIFHQPPGLIRGIEGDWIANKECDNAANLSADYYTKLASGQTEDFIKVFCQGQYGIVGFGKLVYPEYNDALHTQESIESIQGEEIHLGWDGGLTPACVVVQMSARGQLRVLKEYIGEDIGIRSFAENVVIPGLKKDFPYCQVGTSVFDPAGGARDAIMEEMSCISELCSLGIQTIAAKTNNIEARIAAVRFFLNRMVDGQPCFALAKNACPSLRKGFIRDYVYKRLAVSGEERYKDKPDKNMASHCHDSLQYIMLEFASDAIMKDKQPVTYQDMYNPVFNWQG